MPVEREFVLACGLVGCISILYATCSWANGIGKAHEP
jgi:hypothetical protein